MSPPRETDIPMRGKQDHSRERALRRDQTEAERHLWRFLRDRNLGGFKFRRQHRIGPYYADFACTERGVVSYPVRVKVDLPEGVEAPARLSAVTAVVIYQGGNSP